MVRVHLSTVSPSSTVFDILIDELVSFLGLRILAGGYVPVLCAINVIQTTREAKKGIVNTSLSLMFCVLCGLRLQVAISLGLLFGVMIIC